MAAAPAARVRAGDTLANLGRSWPLPRLRSLCVAGPRWRVSGGRGRCACGPRAGRDRAGGSRPVVVAVSAVRGWGGAAPVCPSSLSPAWPSGRFGSPESCVLCSGRTYRHVPFGRIASAGRRPVPVPCRVPFILPRGAIPRGPPSPWAPYPWAPGVLRPPWAPLPRGHIPLAPPPLGVPQPPGSPSLGTLHPLGALYPLGSHTLGVPHPPESSVPWGPPIPSKPGVTGGWVGEIRCGAPGQGGPGATGGDHREGTRGVPPTPRGHRRAPRGHPQAPQGHRRAPRGHPQPPRGRPQGTPSRRRKETRGTPRRPPRGWRPGRGGGCREDSRPCTAATRVDMLSS